MIKFGAGISKDVREWYMRFYKNQSGDLVIARRDIPTEVLVKGHFNGTGIEELLFSDGTSMSRDDINKICGLRILPGHTRGEIMFGSSNIDRIVGAIDGTIYAGAGDDSITAYGGTVYCGDGHDVVGGGTVYNDRIYGEGGNDTIDGYGGDDFIDGGADNDYLIGGAGDDTYVFNQDDGYDCVTESSGNDTFSFTAATNLQIQVQKESMNLIISSSATNNKVLVFGWYDNSKDNKIERIECGNGKVLLSSQVDNLIQSMAQLQAEKGMSWNELIKSNPNEVETVLNQFWVNK